MRGRSRLVLLLVLSFAAMGHGAARRPVDAQHPLWMIHIDVWNKADPQKIIDLVPADIRPYVCFNLSLSCQYDRERKVYKMPQNAVLTYRSWASICELNGVWFTCQPASGGHCHFLDSEVETYESFFKDYPNFLGWNFAEQFWGFDDKNDRSSGRIPERRTLFAKLVEISHRYGGFLTISYCGNVWSHHLNPVGMLKSCPELLEASRRHPDAILWLFKYTTAACFYANESATIGPFVAGLAQNYGIRYDRCGWCAAMGKLLGKNHGRHYRPAACLAPAFEETFVNGGAVWDGPELIPVDDIQDLPDSEVDGFTRRNWGVYPVFRNIWVDLFREIVAGRIRIPSREEVVGRTKVAIVNDMTAGYGEEPYSVWRDLYDGLYKTEDPANPYHGWFMDNHSYWKSTGRYATIPLVPELADSVAKTIPLAVKKSERETVWPDLDTKLASFNELYPDVSRGDLYVSRYRNQLIVYMPFTELNEKKTARANVPLLYNTCERLALEMPTYSAGAVREESDHLMFYLNNYQPGGEERCTRIAVKGAQVKPTFKIRPREDAVARATPKWDASRRVFVLEAWHNGPVDVRINCKGSQKRVRKDKLPTAPLTVDPPKPAPRRLREIVVEAEDMDHRNVARCALDPYRSDPEERGHAGNGFVDFGTNRDGALRHVLKLPKGGAYRLSVRYMNPGPVGTLEATLNGKSFSIPLEHTGNAWKTAAGGAKAHALVNENTLVLRNREGLAVFIDQIVYTHVR